MFQMLFQWGSLVFELMALNSWGLLYMLLFCNPPGICQSAVLQSVNTVISVSPQSVVCFVQPVCLCAHACALQEMDEGNFHWPRHYFITIVYTHVHTHAAHAYTHSPRLYFVTIRIKHRVLNQNQITLHLYTCHTQAYTHTHALTHTGWNTVQYPYVQAHIDTHSQMWKVHGRLW